MVFAPGTVLGPYEIMSLLGKGGMGEVWRARDNRLDRDVAIKTLPAEFANNEERLGRLQRTFAKLCRLLSTNKDLAAKLEQLEKKFDSRFNVVFDAIRKLMEPQVIPPQRRIGFR